MQVKKEEILAAIIEAGLKPPERVTLMITGACNQVCPHCLLDCRQVGDAEPVSPDCIKRIVEQFSELEARGLIVAGGEPLTHPRWLEILSFACSRPGIEDVCLQTNGVLIGEEEIQALLSLPREKISLQVSLDGARAETHDLLRGKGSFDAAVKALRLLSAAGLGHRVRVAFTEMRHNYDELPEAVALVHDLGLARLVSGTLVKKGRSLHWDWIALPSPSQIRALLDRYHRDPAFSRMYGRVGNISAIEWFKGRAFAADQVCECIRTPFIDARGRMYPCVMNLEDDLACGSALDRPLFEIIAGMLPKWAALPETSRRRGFLISQCERCPGRAHCRGGCIGRAKAIHKDSLGVEDRCALRREVYSYQPEIGKD